MEPELLRAVRLSLPSWEADAGHEVEVWGHEDTLSCYTAFSFARGAVEKYRMLFPDEPDELKKKVFEQIRKCHGHLSPAIGHEERLTEEILSNDGGRADENISTDKPASDSLAFFSWCAAALDTDRIDPAEYNAFRSWLSRCMGRQHSKMWEIDALSVAWIKLNRKDMEKGKVRVPGGLDPFRYPWLFKGGRESKEISVVRRGGVFRFEHESRESAEAGEEPFRTGSPLTRARTRNGVIGITMPKEGTDGKSITLYTGGLSGSEIPVPERGTLTIETDQVEITVESFVKQPWAEGIGRDDKGLFVIISEAEGSRKVYWMEPGGYPVENHGTLEIEKGFFWNEEEFDSFAASGFGKPSWADRCGIDEYGFFADFGIEGVVQRMRWIRPGKFMMGSPEDEPDRFDNETLHEVVVTPGVWIAETTVTQELWKAVTGENPSRFKGDDLPVENVSWDDCMEFMEKINGMVPGLELRLPTEAEWEYSCRAGTDGPFHFGNNITTDQVNYDGNHPYADGEKGECREKTVPVKSLPCNDFGLYEMHGNVWEWCGDWHGSYPDGAVVDPVGPDTGGDRVLRGGGWVGLGGDVRSAYRDGLRPSVRYHYTGLRLARGQSGRSFPAEQEAASQSKESEGRGKEKRVEREQKKTDGLLSRFI